MANKDQAIRPAIFNIPSFTKTEGEKKGMTVEEQALAGGAESEFWKTLKQHIDKVIGELDSINDQAVAAGAPLDEIGRNTVVVSLTKGVLKRIFDRVQDAREALDGQ